MTSIQNNLDEVRATLPAGVKLVAVSKFHPLEKLKEAYLAGLRDFGESNVKELQTKQPQMPSDVCWHFIGHLQTNKVKYIAPYIDLIHSVDSFKLMKEINHRASINNRIIKCLLQLHMAEEEQKHGFIPDKCIEMLTDGEWRKLDNIKICGIMTMATNTSDSTIIHRDFAGAKQLFDYIKTNFFSNDSDFSIRSYGMSGDYHIAISEGSNMVRVGTRIFGEREY